jgi:hypothetical protein
MSNSKTRPTESAPAVIQAPAEIQQMSFAMAWHPRLDDDPAHRWLRAMILETAGHSSSAS